MNALIHDFAFDKGHDAGKNFDIEFGDEEGNEVDVHFEEKRVEMFCR